MRWRRSVNPRNWRFWRSDLARLQGLFSLPGKEKTQSQTVAEPRSATESRAPVRHLAIIMDGNGRWASQRHLPRAAGHKAGVDALRRLFWETIRSDVEKLHRNGVRLRHLGRLYDLSPDIQHAVRDMVELTKNNTRLSLNVCFNYGGRAELVDAVRQIVADGHDPTSITEELISSYLYTRDLPDPDLVIRTAGEMRVSNFLLWQSAYSEYYATPTLWPDFGRDDLLEALASFQKRKRRFGK